MLRYSGTSSTINQPILFVNSIYKITYRELKEEVQWSKWVLKILFSPIKKKKTLLLIITIQHDNTFFQTLKIEMVMWIEKLLNGLSIFLISIHNHCLIKSALTRAVRELFRFPLYIYHLLKQHKKQFLWLAMVRLDYSVCFRI